MKIATKEDYVFLILVALGTAASYLSIDIPHTETFIEGRWAFGFIGFALLKRTRMAILLAAILSLVGFHKVPLGIAFVGNMFYVLPALFVIRITYQNFLKNIKNIVLYGIGWVLLIQFCYQIANTPVVWGFMAYINERSVWQGVLEGWRTQPYIVEALFVSIISALSMAAIRINNSLKQSEEKFRSFVENANDVIYSLSLNGEVTYISPNSTELLGFAPTEIIGQHFLSLIYPEDRKLCQRFFENALKAGKKQRGIEYRILHKNGKFYWHISNASPIKDSEGNLVSYIGIARDITEQKKIEKEKEKIQEQLYRSQKMEAIGVLAGGLAHDFNNVLQGVNLYCELLMMNLEEDSILSNYVEQIRIASESATSLARQLLAFSRKQILSLEILDLRKVVENISDMLKRLIGEDIEFTTDFGIEPCYIKADAGQMEQVIMNLAVNSRDAMPEGGKFNFCVEKVQLDDFSSQTTPHAYPGSFARISVSDTGMGMDRETKAHIFEPFFTTKMNGLGTGLGLATVYGIVQQHGGWINVYSEKGRGTKFNIYLPLSEEANLAPTEKISAKEYHGNGERILIVDDEEIIRKSTADMLEQKGYVAFTASTSEEAFVLYSEEEGNFDVVLSDVVLPGESGLVLTQKLMELNPNLPIILASGYTDERSKLDSIKKMGVKFLQKPYSLLTLLTTIHESLDKEGKEL